MTLHTNLVTVCETLDFEKRAAKVWTEAERSEFIDFIAANPRAGDVIEGAGGARKVRWGRESKGKRGGVRVITYFYDESVPVFLLTMFAKNEASDLSPAGKNALREFAKDVKQSRKTGHA
jgi:hypothetical protein